MEVSPTTFPFPKLRGEVYLMLEVMYYIDHPEIYKTMFSLTYETRGFFESNYFTIQNGFINEGLITYEIYGLTGKFFELENLYFQALQRNIKNRKLTLKFYIGDKRNCNLFTRQLEWIKA